MRNFQRQWCIVLGIIGFSLLSGCNLSSESSPPAPNPDTLLEHPEATISVLSAADSEGYYPENDAVDIKVSGKGSLGSRVTCSTLVDKLNATTGLFEPDANNGTLTGCLPFEIFTGQFVGERVGALRLKTTVTDENSLTAEAIKYLMVKNDQIYLTADFNYVLHDLGLSVDLDARISQQGESGAIVQYLWKLYKKEDASEVSTNTRLVSEALGRQATVVLPEDGFYIAELTVKDASGKTVKTQKVFHIGREDTLSVDFTMSLPSPGLAPINLGVRANTVNIEAPVDHYVWEVYRVEEGELTAALYRNTVELPATSLPIVIGGIYVIRLKVIDANGNQHSADQVINIS